MAWRTPSPVRSRTRVSLPHAELHGNRVARPCGTVTSNGGPWPEPAREGYGQSTAALPGTSDVDFLGDLKRVVDLNALVAYGPFQPIARRQ
jgi:hypothetical protein